MKRLWLLIGSLALVGASCIPPPSPPGRVEPELAKQEPQAVLPIAGYASRRTYKQFGEYIADRFRGYHVADDIEYDEVKEEVPVVAIAAGTVRKFGRVSGYGGVAVISHVIGDETVNAIYGHLDLGSDTWQEGAKVERGQFIANLGDSKSAATDGERKHLHFGLYRGDELRLQGYETKAEAVGVWLNPTDFFASHGVAIEDYSRAYNPARDLGGSTYKVRFAIPGGMEVEYVHELQALNIFTLKGAGTARERSQIFIRYFDAASFLTLPTVTIHSTEDVLVGQRKYKARRYDIEKKSGVPNFPYQPTWRNARHTVTDFTNASGFGRYYVVAKNPTLSDAIYQAVLMSLQVVD